MHFDHRSPIFELSDRYISSLAAISPISATFLGIPGYDDKLDDFSLVGSERRADLVRRTLQDLSVLEPQDDIDRIAKDVMSERLQSELALHDSSESEILWNVIKSPVSRIRNVFEMMSFQTDADFANCTARFNLVAGAYKSWLSSIDDLAKVGKVTSRRQTLAVAEKLKVFAQGAYSGIARRVDPNGKYPELHIAAAAADDSAGQASEWLMKEYLPLSNPVDAVGQMRYSQWARHFTGAELDLRATYEWGLEDLARINERMWKVAAKIKPGAQSLREVAEYLDHDPQYTVQGTELLLKKLDEFTRQAVKAMDGVHFDIDDRIKVCEVRLAPDGSASAPYYESPSEDLSRPGTTWYPALGKETFR
jgi:uncharacterized protein (DUF885 family)